MSGGFNLVILSFAVSVAALLGCGCGPSTPSECLNRASVAASEGKWKQALKFSNRAVEMSPGDVNALVFKAVAGMKCGDVNAALDAATRAVSINPESFPAQYTLGRICISDPTRGGDAMRALVKAFKLRRGDRDTLVLLCNLASDMGSPNALPFLLMLKRNPEFSENPVLYNQLGLAYVNRGDLNNAKQSFMTAWKLDKDNPEIIYNAGCFFDRYTGAGSTAAALYRRYLQLTEGKAQAGAVRAKVAARLTALGGGAR